jgi:hypothetical protein
VSVIIDERSDLMKNRVLTVLVASTLVLAASGSTLAAGKLGGASGMDQLRNVCPARTAGKMGGISGGIDRLSAPASVESEGGKVGGGMDRCDPSIFSLASL